MDSDISTPMQVRRHDSNRGLNPMLARLNALEVRQRGDETDRPMPTHAKIAHVIEEDHSRGAGWIDGLAEQRANHHIETARLIDHCGSEAIVIPTKTF
jgi:hypothetical protein